MSIIAQVAGTGTDMDSEKGLAGPTSQPQNRHGWSAKIRKCVPADTYRGSPIIVPSMRVFRAYVLA